MDEKYINKILTFSDDIIGRAEELTINRNQAKSIIKELEEDYMPKAIINLKITELKREYKQALEENSTKAFILKCQIEILEKILKGE